jgi:beta-glucosidase
VEDLLGQMTLEEKAGPLFINGAEVPRLNAKLQMTHSKMTHFNLWAIPTVKAVSTWYNRIQAFAEGTRLGSPVTITSDPRNHFSHNIFDMLANKFSRWPNAIGFGAIRDPGVVRQSEVHRGAGTD